MVAALSHKDVMKISQMNGLDLGEELYKGRVIRYDDEYPGLQRCF